MDNIIIGIVSRLENLDDGLYNVISESNVKYLKDKCSYIGIIDNNIDIHVLNLCDGIIITGGNEIFDYHFKILDYCIDNNIPVLGICMGCQIIGLYSFNGKDSDLIKIKNHYMKNHNVNINKDSILYSILGDNVIVNSRHKYALPSNKIKYKIGAFYNDIVESIESINKKHFLLGIQWHPEDMDNMGCIYNYFLKEVLKRNKERKYDY